MEFAKATLQEVSAKPSASPILVGEPVTVQINPASLRLQLTNNVDSGKALARPSTQSQGSSSSTLSFDLIFDTADEGSTESPVDVRTRTRRLERFLLPGTGDAKAAPPRVKFTYGTFTVVGVMSSMSEDFDFFAMNGVPLRAKCAVTIKEQKPEFDAKLTGPGANTGAGAVPPLPPQQRPGAGARRAPAPPDRTGTALAGESAAAFAVRMGLDPRAWKDLAGTLANPLSLAAGLQIDFSASASLAVGLGVEIGATAGAATGVDGGGAVPLTPAPAASPEGPELTAAGGLTRALDREAARRSGLAADKARAAFGMDTGTPAGTSVGFGAGTSARPDPGTAPFGEGRTTGPAPDGRTPSPAATRTADPRALSYGFGVPLRPRQGLAALGVRGLVHTRVRGVAAVNGIPESDDPTMPRWEALPAAGTAARAPGDAGRTGCRCGGSCRDCGRGCAGRPAGGPPGGGHSAAGQCGCAGGAR